MAEFTEILNVETGQAVKSVGELKQTIKQLKQDLDKAAIGSKEYQDTLGKLRVSQNALRDAMHASSASLEEVTASANGLGDSYNSLVHQMAELKEEWKSTTDAARRADLGTQIKAINDRLKELDAGTGNFQRNVGDYANQMESAFSKTAGGAAQVINPLKGMTAGFKALSATPAIAIIGLLANLIFKVVEALKSSETNMEGVSEAMGLFNAIGNVTTKVLQYIGKGLAAMVGWIGKALKSLGLLTDSMKDHQTIAKEEIAIEQLRRKEIVQTAKEELEVSELRAKVAQKEKYTNKERLTALDEAISIEEGIAKRKYDLAKREFELLKLKAAQSDNSIEDNRALAEAEAKVYEQEKALNDKKRELYAQRVEIINAMAAENKKLTSSTKETTAADKEEAEAVEKTTESLAKQVGEKNKLIDREADRRARALEYEIADEQKRADALYEIEKNAMERKRDLIKEALEEEAPDAQLTPEERLEMQQELADLEVDIEVAKFREIKRLQDKAAKDDEDNKAKQLAKEEAYKDAIFNIMGGLASMLESNDKVAKKSAGVIKTIRIAQATMSTYQSAVDAYRGAVESLGFPAGPIVGGIQAAAAVAMGIANINKIRQTRIGDSGGSSTGGAPSVGGGAGAVVPPPQVQSGIETIATLRGDTERAEDARSQKVYILSSDLEANGRRVEVRDNETEF